jgi:hypothetical protein
MVKHPHPQVPSTGPIPYQSTFRLTHYHTLCINQLLKDFQKYMNHKYLVSYDYEDAHAVIKKTYYEVYKDKAVELFKKCRFETK